MKKQSILKNEKPASALRRYAGGKAAMNPRILLTAAVSAAVTACLCVKQPAGMARDNPFDQGGSNWHPPAVTAMDDTLVKINDTLAITAVGSDNGSVVKYLWAKDGSDYADTTAAGTLNAAWSDSGRHVVRVKAVDNDGLASAPDTCIVYVSLGSPVVTAMEDTVIAINDTIMVTAVGMDDEAVVMYVWAKDGATYADTTAAGALNVVWPDIGRRVVRVKAVDNDGVASPPDSCVVYVTPDGYSWDSSIVLWFPIDDTIMDISLTRAIPLNVSSVTLVADRYGTPDRAALFSGSASKIDLPFNEAYRLHAMTVCAWVYLQRTGFDQKVLGMSRGGADSYNLGIYADNKVELWINDGNWYGVRGVSGGAVLQQSQWYFIAGVYDGDTIKTYVNGAQDRQAVAGNRTILYNVYDSMNIGYCPTGTYVLGRIDVPAAELLALYNN
jgi:hypothetical protein